jgi:2-dehydropantoate 2-reductase
MAGATRGMNSMDVSFDKVCIVGAGAIGGWIGARLAAAGSRVAVLARGATLERLQTLGLELSSGADDQAPIRVAVQSAADAQTLGPQDLVVIAVKSPALPQVARQIGPLLGPDTVVLTAMNGVPWWFLQGFGGAVQGHRLSSVDPNGELARAMPAPHVVGCVVHASCSLDGPAQVRHHFGNGLIIGEPSGTRTPRVQALQALLARAGFAITLSEQIQKDIWYKLWGNMTVNPVSAFTGATTDLVLADPLVRNFISRVMLEAREIGARIGLPIEQTPEDRHAVTRKLGAFKPSMLQDVEAGRPVELDTLVAVVRELGELTGVPTPWTDTLLGLARLHARVHGLY